MLSNAYVGYIVPSVSGRDTQYRKDRIREFVSSIAGATLLEVVEETAPLQDDGQHCDDGLSMIERYKHAMAVIVVDALSDIKIPAMLSSVIRNNIAVLRCGAIGSSDSITSNFVKEALSIHRSLYSAFIKLCDDEMPEPDQGELKIDRKNDQYFRDIVLVPLIKELFSRNYRFAADIVRELERMRKEDKNSAPTGKNAVWYPRTLELTIERHPELQQAEREWKARVAEMSKKSQKAPKAQSFL